MDKAPDRYRSLAGEGMCEFTEKKSRFIGFAAAALHEAQAQAYIAGIHARYPDCSAVLYGYICGYAGNLHRFHDAHEPQGGLQILEAIKRRELTGAVAAVVRYYGGTPLGAGPLGRAFGRAAIEAVEQAHPAWLERTLDYRVEFPYELSGRLEHFFEHSPYRLEGLAYAEGIQAQVKVKCSDEPLFLQDMAALTHGKAAPEITASGYMSW